MKLNFVKRSLVVGAMVLAPLAVATPVLAATTPPPFFPLNLPTVGAVTLKPGQTSYQVNLTNFDSALLPPQTETFYYVIPGDTNINDVITVTGSEVSPGSTAYNVPVPNFTKPTEVYIEAIYAGANGGQGAIADGPLLDTLPEAPLVALLPLAMIGVWMWSRRKKSAKLGAAN